MKPNPSRLHNQPLLIDEDYANTVQSNFPESIESREDSPTFTPLMVDGEECATNFFAEGAAQIRRSYPVVNGIAIISVYGSLYHRESFAGYSYTGYDSIIDRHRVAESDPEVKGIMLDINSHGGEVAGCFDCVDEIVANKRKPLWAMVDHKALSAGYAIACCADKILMTKTATVGSVGVVTMHIDQSKMLEDQGVKPTMLFSGKHKVDGNPYEALPSDVRERIQLRLDTLYDVFVSTVADNRGMTTDSVRATEAGVYSANDALAVGLADMVESPIQARSIFVTELFGSPQEDVTMSKNDDGADANSQGPTAQDVANAKVEGMNEGAIAERGRIQAIMALDEAKASPTAADKVAMSTNMSVEEAKDFLTGMPAEVPERAEAPAPEQAAAPAAHFEEAMGAGNPELGAGEELAEVEAEAPNELASMFAIIGRSNGRS